MSKETIRLVPYKMEENGMISNIVRGENMTWEFHKEEMEKYDQFYKRSVNIPFISSSWKSYSKSFCDWKSNY